MPLNDSFRSIPSIFPSFLNPLNPWQPAHTECHLSDMTVLGAGAAHPAQPKLISESMINRYVKAAA